MLDKVDRLIEGVVPVVPPKVRRWRPAIWWPFGLGVLFLLTAIGLEHGLWVSRAGADATAHPVSHSGIFRFETLVLLTSEVGYAFIIAWVVSYFIEAAAKREQGEAFAESMSQISREVFRGVFRIRHKPEYVRAVVASCLETRLVREDYDLTYTVDAFTPEQQSLYEVDSNRFVQVSTTIRYRARNIGTKPETFTTSYGIPIRSGKLRDLSALTGLRVGSKVYDPSEIAALLVTERPTGHLPSETMYRFPFTLKAQDSVEILIEATLVKELSDSETFGFGLPTMSAAIRLNMNVPHIRFGATPRIIGELVEVRSPDKGRLGEWKIDHPILPYNSVILWWRSPEDDGRSAQSGDAAANDQEGCDRPAVAHDPASGRPSQGLLGKIARTFREYKPSRARQAGKEWHE